MFPSHDPTGDFGDINGDGREELIYMDAGYNYKVYQWNGTRWNENTTMSSGLTNPGSVRIIISEDFDLDNNLELLIYDINGNTEGYEWSGSSWLENNNTRGGISQFPGISGSGSLGGTYGDFNNDSIYELLIARQTFYVNKEPAFSPYIEIGNVDGTREWNYTGYYNLSQNTSNLVNQYQSYLNSCTVTSDNICSIPITFFAERGGLQASLLNLVHTPNDYEFTFSSTITGEATRS